MQESQNELFINRFDPWNAVVYDRGWLLQTLASNGLALAGVASPEIRGHQWTLVLGRASEGFPVANLPDEDTAPFGIRRAGSVADAARIGIQSSECAQPGTLARRHHRIFATLGPIGVQLSRSLRKHHSRLAEPVQPAEH